MYQPRHFQEQNTARMVNLIEQNPLSVLILADHGSFEVNHIPLVAHTDESGIRKLQGHIPRANSLAGLATTTQDCLAIFQGAQGYITPSWYATKPRHGKVVPTWNYSVVHVHGKIKTVNDPLWLMQHLQDLTALNEKTREQQWQVSDAPKDFTDGLVSALVGLEITATKVEAKTKASQNQPEENRTSVLQNLSSEQPDSSFSRMMHDANHEER